MNQTSNINRFAILLVLLGGILLRVLVFLQNRSLFIDEANLARNIAERSLPQLFQNLDYEQYAPPIYLSIVKGFCLIFGNTEWAFRGFSLVCGIASLLVFYGLLKRMDRRVLLAWYPLFILAFSLVFVRYSTEVKQYACDVLVALSLLYLVSDHRFSWEGLTKNSLKWTVFWAILGGGAIWLSMPSIFFLAAIGLGFFIKSLRVKGAHWFPIVLVGVVWLSSFGLYYWMILSGDIGDDNLKGYHAPFFFPIFPTSVTDVQQMWALVRQFFGSTFGSTVVAIGWGMFSVAWGSIELWRKNRFMLFLLTVPILLVLLASSFHYYSLIKRLTLFFLPNLLLLSYVGTRTVFGQAHVYLKYLLFLALVIICVNQKGLPYFFQKYEMEELRPLLYKMKKDWSEVDLVYVHNEAVPAYAFYTEHFRAKKDFGYLSNTTILRGDWERQEKDLIEVLKKKPLQNFGIIFSHCHDAEMKRTLDALKPYGRVSVTKQTEGAQYVILASLPTPIN